jgi:hypothetical protein
VVEYNALEDKLGGPPGGELDVGRRKQARLLDYGRRVNPGVRHLRQVPLPDGEPGLLVRRADGDEVVKPPVPQERRVELAHGIRGADQQPLFALAERRDELEHLVGDPLPGGGSSGLAQAGDLLDFIDEDHDPVQFGDQGECLPQRARQAGRRGAGQAGREQFHERPAEPGRDARGERGLAGAGRPEQDDRLRRDQPEAAGDR